jgi:diaminopimelate decarboxylase
VETTAATWWVRPGLEVAHGGLRIAGRDAEALARQHGTPLFIYDRTRFGEKARRRQGALAATGLPFRQRFALKANPLPEILDVFRGLGEPGAPDIVGIDACSPGEVERAIDLRLSRGRDQLHRHERVGARFRRPSRA